MTLFCAQRFHWINGSSTLRWYDAGDEGAEAQGGDGTGQYQRVPALDLIQLRGEQMTASDRNRNADDEADDDLPKGPAQNQANDVAAVGAQGHAYANLTGAPLYRICRDPVETHGGKQEREQAKSPVICATARF